jgi:HD-GYP domain-containing protein (c-di-GMP phosphodiesterase class II)
MVLAKTLYDSRGNVILPAGSLLGPYREQIAKFKIQFLYVHDQLSEGIEAWNIISADTREEIHEAMKKAAKIFQPMDGAYKKTFTNLPYHKLAKKIAEDVSAQPEVRIDVTELQTNRPYPFEHELNVGIIAALIGRLMGLTSVDLANLCLGGLLHDIGRLTLAQAQLDKIGVSEFTASEWDIFRQYPLMGYNMLKQDNSLALAVKASVLQHMERYDGTGFPTRKKEDGIHQAAKIIAIANAFDELCSGRSITFGKKPMKIYEVVEYIQSNIGTLFDPEIAGMFVKHALLFPNGTIVRLSDGSKGIVINQNEGLTARPIIRLMEDGSGKPSLRVVNLLENMSLVINDIEV